MFATDTIVKNDLSHNPLLQALPVILLTREIMPGNKMQISKKNIELRRNRKNRGTPGPKKQS